MRLAAQKPVQRGSWRRAADTATAWYVKGTSRKLILSVWSGPPWVFFASRWLLFASSKRRQVRRACHKPRAVIVRAGNSSNAGYLANVCVSPVARRRRVGEEMLDRVRPLAREWGEAAAPGAQCCCVLLPALLVRLGMLYFRFQRKWKLGSGLGLGVQIP
jgi:hypothetical protein